VALPMFPVQVAIGILILPTAKILTLSANPAIYLGRQAQGSSVKAMVSHEILMTLQALLVSNTRLVISSNVSRIPIAAMIPARFFGT